MGIIGYDVTGTSYVIAAQNYGGTGLNQLSGAAPQGPNSILYDEVDTGGSWVAGSVAVPESTLTTMFAGVAALGMAGWTALRRKRSSAA